VRIVLRHMMPLCLPSVIVRVTLDMAGIILTAAGLGFLGLGAQPPLPEWGAMIAAGRAYVLDQWWVAPAPALPSSSSAWPSTCWATGCATRWTPSRRSMNAVAQAMTDRPMDAPAEAGGAPPLLTVADLRVASRPRWCTAEVVRGVSFTLGRERLGIVGESGSGKSQTGRAILGLTAPGGRVTAQSLRFAGIDLRTCPERERRSLRGGRIAMVLQDPKYALDPVMTVGAQIAETLRATPASPARALRRACTRRC
jgi:hypothetical protein